MSLRSPLVIYRFLLLGSLMLAGELIQNSHAVRVRLHPDVEPNLHEVYNNYRMIETDSNRYYLKSAGLLNDSDIGNQQLEDYRDSDGKFVKGKFIFNSSEHMRKQFTFRWKIPYTERSALQTYDDPRERDLAAGPQVDQESCGLHLDYMLHMVNKHNKNFDNSTELSIAKIMLYFDYPRLGVYAGNNLFLGDYVGCKEQNLNIIRRELAEVNQTAAERYFEAINEKQLQLKKKLEREHTLENDLYKGIKTIGMYVSTFLGFPKKPESLAMDKYSDRIWLSPMRYCLSSLRWPSWKNSSYHIRNHNFKTAVCLPETCDSNSLKLHGDKIRRLARTQMSDYYDGFYISELYCLPDEKSELRNPLNNWSTIIFVAFNAIWLTLIVIATIFSYAGKTKPISVWRDFLICWSFRKNLRDFLAVKPSADTTTTTTTTSKTSNDNENSNKKTAKFDSSPLEGFKVVSSFSVILAHAFVIGFVIVWNPQRGHPIMTRGWLAMANTLPPAIVDNFFVTTGIVTARVLFKMNPKTLVKPTFWFKFMVYRYIRIVPLYLFTHWFLQSTFRFLGDGPMWDYGTSHSAWSNLCSNESWWTIILPSANLKSPALHCNGVGWYLACDLQFMLLTPFVVVLLLKKPLLGYITISSSIVALMANHVYYFLTVDQDVRSQIELSLMLITRVLDETSKGYTFPQYRSPAFLIGLLAGHLLHLYETDIIKEWPKAFVTYGKAYLFFILYLICFSPYLASLIPLGDENFMRVFGAVKEGTLHGVTSIAAALLILFICTGQLRYIAELYSGKAFGPLANASLCTLLVHIPLMLYHTQSLRTLPELSSYSMVNMTLTWAVQAYLLSMVVHILYELPIRKSLVKLLLVIFGEYKAKSTKKQLEDKTK